jgi:hypothetical protein
MRDFDMTYDQAVIGAAELPAKSEPVFLEARLPALAGSNSDAYCGHSASLPRGSDDLTGERNSSQDENDNSDYGERQNKDRYARHHSAFQTFSPIG